MGRRCLLLNWGLLTLGTGWCPGASRLLDSGHLPSSSRTQRGWRYSYQYFTLLPLPIKSFAKPDACASFQEKTAAHLRNNFVPSAIKSAFPLQLLALLFFFRRKLRSGTTSLRRTTVLGSILQRATLTQPLLIFWILHFLRNTSFSAQWHISIRSNQILPPSEQLRNHFFKPPSVLFVSKFLWLFFLNINKKTIVMMSY